MRTLFLLAILATLLVIAVKKPDQTAWDAARELSGRAKTVLSKVQQPVAETLPFKPFSKPAQTSGTAAESNINEKSPDRSSAKALAKRLSPKPAVTNERESQKPAHEEPKPKAVRRAAPLNPPAEAKRPKVKVARGSKNEWSELPTIPVTPHPIHTPKLFPPSAARKTPAAPVVSKPIATPRADYADVKVYYENASRLLDEIK